MTILFGTLQSVSGTPFGGPGCAVLIYSRMTRPGYQSDAVILELRDRIPMPVSASGQFETGVLDPGPIRVELEGGTVHGRGWNIDLPEDGVHSLASLIDAQVEWSPAVVSRAETAAAEASAAAVRAESAAVLLESAVADAAGMIRDEVSSDADRAVVAREGAELARDAAVAAQSGAETAASTAESAAVSAADDVRDELEYLSDAAGLSAQAAAASAADAGGSAQAAAASEVAAASSADAAGMSAQAAAASEAAIGSALSDAEAAASAASQAAITAGGHATTAGDHAQTALSQADRSSMEADRAEAAAQSAETGVQPDSVGRTHLTPALRSEIDGKAPSSHVHSIAQVTDLRDELDGKAPSSHVHTIGQVTGLQSALDGKSDDGHVHTWDELADKPEVFPPAEHTHTAEETGAVPQSWLYSGATGQSAMWRRADGTSDVGTPTQDANATPKSYVDAADQAWYDAAADDLGEVAGRVSALENSQPIIVSEDDLPAPGDRIPGRIYFVI